VEQGTPAATTPRSSLHRKESDTVWTGYWSEVGERVSAVRASNSHFD
jgi:hypothetical protein